MTAPFGLRAALEHMNVEPGQGTIWASISIEARSRALEVARAPLAVALVVDVSGSMAGEPLEKALQSCEQIFTHVLGAGDEVAIVTFASRAGVCCELTALDDAGKARLRAALRAVKTADSTNLHEGLGLAEGVLQGARAGLRRALVVLSDGKPNVGLRSAAQLGAYVRGLGIATSSLGFGLHFSEDVLDAIAAAGSGRFSYISNPASARSDLARAVEAQAGVVADRLELRLRPSAGVEVVQVLPASELRFGAEGVALRVGDVFEDEARALAVELRFDLGRETSGRLLEVALEGHAPGAAERHSVSASLQVDVRAGGRVVDAAAQRAVLLLQADAARLAARALADGGARASAAVTLREAIGRIEALDGFVRNDGSPLAELREQLVDSVARLERRATRRERSHHRKADFAYKPASPYFARSARQRPALAARLVGVEGPASGRVEELWTETLIGRSPLCDVVIDNPSISRNHARIQFVDDHFLIVDLGAAAGTRVNGRELQSARLVDGDVIQLGEAVLRFESAALPAQGSLPGFG